jgi:hypothetical protein
MRLFNLIDRDKPRGLGGKELTMSVVDFCYQSMLIIVFVITNCYLLFGNGSYQLPSLLFRLRTSLTQIVKVGGQHRSRRSVLIT